MGVGGRGSALGGSAGAGSDGWSHFGHARNLVELVPRGQDRARGDPAALAGSLTDASLEEDGLAMARAPAPGHTARTVAIGNYPRRGEVATWPNFRENGRPRSWQASQLEARFLM